MRRLLNVCTALSFVLFLAALAGWVRSHFVSDRVEWARFTRDGNVIKRRSLEFWLGEGGLACKFFSATDTLTAEIADELWRQGLRELAGLHHYKERPRHPADVGLQINPLIPARTRRTARMTPFNRAGFYGALSKISPSASEQITSGHVAVPFWFLCLLTGPGPALWAVKRWRRERLAMTGHCPGCGYDLRESPGVCPECGRDAATIPAPRPLFHSPATARAIRLAASISALSCAGFAVLYVFALASAPSMDPDASRHMFYLDSYIPAAPHRLSISTCILITALLPAARAVVVLARRLRRAPVETPAEKPISPATGLAPARTL